MYRFNDDQIYINKAGRELAHLSLGSSALPTAPFQATDVTIQFSHSITRMQTNIRENN